MNFYDLANNVEISDCGRYYIAADNSTGHWCWIAVQRPSRILGFFISPEIARDMCRIDAHPQEQVA